MRRIGLLISILALTLAAGAQTPMPMAAYLSPSVGIWNPWTSTGGFGSLSFTPPAIGLYCQATSGGPWQPCNPSGSGTFVTLSGDATSTATGGATTVVGLMGVPFCTGFTPTTGQAVTYTTASSPNPCYTAAASGGGTTTNALTGAATGGAAPGSTFNGSAAVTFDFHTLGAQVALSLLKGTYTDGDMCTYASTGTLLNCNTAIPSAYTLPTATSSILGGVKPDGTTISNTAGAIAVATPVNATNVVAAIAGQAIAPSSVASSGAISSGATPPTACGSASGCLAVNESSAAGTPTAGQDYLYVPSGTHKWTWSLNDGTETSIWPVVQGGTGLATLTPHSIQIGEGTSSPNQMAVCGTGVPVVGVTGADPICSASGALGTNAFNSTTIPAAQVAANLASSGTTGVTGLLPHANIASTAVTPGSYTSANITVAADGSITAAANGSGGMASYPSTNVKTLGAVGDGQIAWNGSMATYIPTPTYGSSTTASAPAITTNFANDDVVSIFFDYNEAMSSPSVGTTRLNATSTGGGTNAPMLSDQTVASAGSVPAVTATLAGSNVWLGVTLPLVPTAGHTISFIAGSSNTGSSAYITVNQPSGAAAGDVEVGCLLWYSFGTNNITASPTQFYKNYVLPVTTTAFGGTHPFWCWTRVVTTSDPSSYTWTQNNSSSSFGWGVVLADYRNVGGIDDPITQSTWSASTACARGQQIVDSNNNLQMCSLAGTTGSGSHPVWATGYGVATTDGSAAWVMRGTAPVFSSADQGKLLCFASSQSLGASGNCGQVGNVISSTEMLPLGFANPAAGALVSREYRYATDDTTYLQACINESPVTCTFPQGNYGLSAPLIFKPNYPFVGIGVGRGVPTDFNAVSSGFANSIDTTTLGSSLWVMSYSLNTAALQFLAPSSQSDSIVTQQLQHLSIYGGAGKDFAGGGADGIDLLNWNRLILDDVAISNFFGNGIYIDATSSAGANYSESNLIANSFIDWNGGNGVQYGSTTGTGYYIDSNTITNSVVAANGLAGVEAYSGVRGLTISNSKVIDNNVSDTANLTEVYFLGSPVAVALSGNYFESYCNGGFGAGPFNYTTSLAGNITGLGSNEISPICTLSPAPTLHFSAAGIPLPTLTGSNAAQYNYLPPITVTDATTCTAGGTYTSGGSTECGVVAIGTTWKTTGAFQ